MKLKILKEIINNLTKSQLEEELYYNSDEFSLSGLVFEIKVQDKNLYILHEEHPSKLYYKEELEFMGLDEEEILECEIEIPKGVLVLEF